MEIQGPHNSQNNQENIGRLKLSYFKTYYKIIVSRLCSSGKRIDIQANQNWSRIDSSEINFYIYGQLIFFKSAKAIQRGNHSKIVLEQLCINIQKKEVGPIPLITCKNYNLIKNLEAETIKHQKKIVIIMKLSRCLFLRASQFQLLIQVFDQS